MAIEGNKDEAEKCLDIAQLAFAVGNYEKAERFVLKAERLFPTSRAKELLNKVKKASAAAGASSASSAGASNPEDVFRRRSTPTHQPQQREYSAEQLEAVRKVNVKSKDYYEILCVSKEATDSDIKKAYKKLALLLHPDKNHAPGAAEAFKAIGNAAAVLTDPEKRKLYDTRGDETQVNSRGQHQYYARGFESDLTAEELFNMFFGGSAFPGAGMGGVYARRRPRAPPEPRESHAGLTQLLPLGLLLVLTLMSGLFVSDPVYSLTPSSKYPVPRETANIKAPYYVKENFHTEYQGSLRRLEISIEEEFLANLRQSCQREINYRETMAWKARNFGDARQHAQAQRLRTPSCEKLQQINNQIYK